MEKSIRFNKFVNLFFIVILLVFTNSCNENVLEEVPLDFLSAPNSYDTPEGLELGINSLHEKNRELYLSNWAGAFCLWTNGTDVTYDGESPGGSSDINNYDVFNASASIPSSFWGTFYNIISTANTIIAWTNKLDESKYSEEKKLLEAEARFFRGYSYRILVTLFGDIPLISEEVTVPRNDFVRDPKSEVYKLIEEDFIYGTENLPERGQEKGPGRITQGAAWHLLSETYIAQEKFQLAVDAASHVINDYGYALMTERFGTQKNIFKGENVYTDLFRFGNQNIPENTESIWVIQMEPNIRGGGEIRGMPKERAYGPRYYSVGTTPDGYWAIIGDKDGDNYTGISDSLGRPVAWQRPTSLVLYTVWQSDFYNDLRNSESNIKRNFYYDNPQSAYYKQKIDFSLYPEGSRNTFKDTTNYIFPYYMKFASPLQHFTWRYEMGSGEVHKDWYAIRLAETYLLRAEAYLGLNDKDKAADDINEVRNRAHATPVQPGDVDIDYILDERIRELFGEEMRRVVLGRTNKLIERTRKYNDNPVRPGLNIKNHHILWPIPQSEIDLNSGSDLGQNDGYLN